MNRSAKGLEGMTDTQWLPRRLGALSILGAFSILSVLLAWTLGVPSMALASDSNTVSGVVRDGDGRALAGASVTLTSHSETANISRATSGPTGEYRFSGLSDGEYSVGAEMAGYAAASGRVVQLTGESNTATIDLVLIRSSIRGRGERTGKSGLASDGM